MWSFDGVPLSRAFAVDVVLGVGAVEGPLTAILRYHVVACAGRAPAVWGALLRGVGRWPHGGLAIMRRVLMQCMRN